MRVRRNAYYARGRQGEVGKVRNQSRRTADMASATLITIVSLYGIMRSGLMRVLMLMRSSVHRQRVFVVLRRMRAAHHASGTRAEKGQPGHKEQRDESSY